MFRTARNRVNKALQGFCRHYFDGLPIGDLAAICQAQGVTLLDSDGVYCGGDGHCTFELDFAGATVQNALLVLDWHKMESGRYEVNAYVS
jgi:hypothetical protein